MIYKGNVYIGSTKIHESQSLPWVLRTCCSNYS